MHRVRPTHPAARVTKRWGAATLVGCSILAGTVGVVAAEPPGGAAGTGGSEGVDPLSVSALKRLSLEELANMEITSVTKSGGALSATPAAVHVVTGEDVVRSGVTTIPEALRWVPG